MKRTPRPSVLRALRLRAALRKRFAAAQRASNALGLPLRWSEWERDWLDDRARK